MKERILKFLKDKYNLTFIIILFFSLILRLKYLTINQSIWFDEGVYLSTAKRIAFNIPYVTDYVRPVVYSFFMAILYKLGANELVFRIINILFSLLIIILTYSLGVKFFNKKIALIATAISSFHYLYLFYTARLLLEVPSLALWLLAIYLFYIGYIQKKSKYYIWLFGLVLSINILIRFPNGLLAFIILAYLVITEKLNFLKNKDLWISSIFFIIPFIPYSIWYYITYNKIAIISVLTSPIYESRVTLMAYLKLFPVLLQSPIPFLKNIFPMLGHFLLIAFIFGLFIILFNLIIGFDMIRKNEMLKNQLFILIWLIITFSYFAFILGLTEDRYLFSIYPIMFYLVGLALTSLNKFIKIKGILTTMIIVILFTSGYSQLIVADNLIKIKANSYIQFRWAGEYIKANSNKDDLVISSGLPQLTYYSEREGRWYPTEKDFEELIRTRKPKFMILTGLEGSPPWSYDWPSKHQDIVKPVQVYFIDKEKTKPLMIVYEFINWNI